MPKLEIHGITEVLASTHHRVKFHATDDVRGECEITITSYADVEALASLLNDTLAAWQRDGLEAAGFKLVSVDAA